MGLGWINGIKLDLNFYEKINLEFVNLKATR